MKPLIGEVNGVMREFELIDYLLQRQRVARQDVVLGIGDDCALLEIPSGYELAVSIDTLVADVHFAQQQDPYDIGYKALAVNLSDLAAMGADPAWVTVALTLPVIERAWLARFCSGLFDLAEKFGMQLIGGDTTAGPLSMTLQVHGFVPKGKALKRSGAQPGDLIYVTGVLGSAGLALLLAEQAPAELAQRLLRPTPQIATGMALRDVATSAIDISDGLAADLSHILARSQVGATLQVDRLPLSETLMTHTSILHAQQLALSAGDDYELCFTVPPAKVNLLSTLTAGTYTTCIGIIDKNPGLRLVTNDGSEFNLEKLGYQHFSNSCS